MEYLANTEITLKNANNVLEKNIAKESKFEELLKNVTERRLNPEDPYEVAAILESMGWNDEMASEIFGADDIFSLALDIWNAIRERIAFSPYNPAKKESVISVALTTVRTFLRGLIFALPMAISVTAMLTLRFSLWSYEYLTLDLATSIAIGTILSFMTVGGFTQSIARRGFFYISQSYYNMARRITFFFIKLGYISAFLFSLVFLIFNTFFEIFPLYMSTVIIVFYFFLTSIWLSVTVMYILKKEIAFAGLITVGILFVLFFYRFVKLDIIHAQILSLILISILSMIFVLYYFRISEEKMEKGIQPLLPRMSIILYSVIPYFVYGFLYFSFLFADRVIAWSTNNMNYMPYFIWFRGQYELGLDFAIITLLLPLGFVEAIISRFMSALEKLQKQCFVSEVGTRCRIYLNYYLKKLFFIFSASLLVALFTYFALKFIIESNDALSRINIFINQTSHFVFVVALISYSFLAVGLMNAIILFAISQPEMVNESIFPAIIANTVTGFLLSRWVDYSWAVLGLLAGSAVFMALSAKKVIKVLRNFDYYLYMAT